MHDFIDTLNESRSLSESLGRLNTGTSELREVVKALLQHKSTNVSPNSNIVNFTVSDVSEVPKKVMQIASSSDETVAAIYLANAEGKGIVIFNRNGFALEEKITKTTQIGVVSRDNGPWSIDGFRLQNQFDKTSGKGRSKSIRFQDVANFDMRGSISCAVIFSGIDRARLNNDRYQAQRNDDPLNQTKTYRDYVRRENLKIHQAKKGVAPIVVNQSLKSLTLSQSKVVIIALEDNKRSKRFDKVAVVFEDLGAGRYWLHSLI